MFNTEKIPETAIIYGVFYGLAFILMAMGLYFSPSNAHLFEGYLGFIKHPCLIDFDGLQQAGHFGTAFFNAGVQLIVVLLVYKWTNTEISGVQIAAAMMIVGFSFYGKDLANVWWPVIGVFAHTIMLKQPLKTCTALAWFSTALSPVFSSVAFNKDVLVPGSPVAILSGAVMGILCGVILSVIAHELPKLHQGYILFNAGFAAGIAGMFINALQKAVGLGHDKYAYVEVAQALKEGIRADYVSGQNDVLGVALVILLSYLIIAGIALGGSKEFLRMIWVRCKGGNFVEKHGVAACLINMGFLGLISTAYILITPGGQLGGPTYACVWTAVGFAAYGVTLRMYLPTMGGVFLAALITGGLGGLAEDISFFEAGLAKVSSRGMLLAAIYSCGMAPIAGEHGVLAGLFVGVAHAILVPNIGVLHGWMSLYNNGLSLSFIAVFMHPIYSKLHIHYEKKKTAAT